MKSYEIERKYLIHTIPFDLKEYAFHDIEQGYLCTEPVVRIRKQDDTYYLTYKSKGLMVREEYNLPLTAEAYAHLREKADGKLITKRRYLIPRSVSAHTIYLPLFLDSMHIEPLLLSVHILFFWQLLESDVR